MIQDLDRAGLQRNARRQLLAEMGADRSRPRRQVETRSEMRRDDGFAGGVLKAHHLLEHPEGQLAADARRRALHGAKDHRLGIDEQAVHVEDHGPDDAREDHQSVMNWLAA